MEALVVCLFCVPLLAVTLASLWLRRRSLGLLDMFLLSIALYFGAYTLIDLMVNDIGQFSGFALFFTFAPVATTACILWLVARSNHWTRDYTSLDFLQRKLGACPNQVVVGALSVAVLLAYFSASVISAAGIEDIGQLYQMEMDLPYWYKAFAVVAPSVVFTAGLASAAKAFNAPRPAIRLFWIAATCAALWFFFGLGRRSLFAMLVVLGLMLIRNRKHFLPIFLAMVLVVPVFLSASNVYQTYRTLAYKGVIVDEQALDVGRLLEAATDPSLTITNLQEREAMWRNNAAIVAAHQRGRDLLWGELFLMEIPNYLPAVLFPNKRVVTSELELQRAFGLDETDKAENIFGMSYGDFGLLNLVFAPAMVLVLVYIVARVVRWLKNDVLRGLALSSAMFYAINMEVNYVMPIQMARDFLVVTALYIAARGFYRTFLRMRRSRMGKRTISPPFLKRDWPTPPGL